MQLFIGFLLALVIAYAAYRAHSLNRSGALAAVVVGTVIFGIGGWQWAILLLTFFITSSGLSRAFKKRKAGLNEKYSKGSQRDAGQVFGNGGLATLFAGLHYFFPAAPGGDDLAFVQHLLDEQILAVPGRGFGCPGYFRLAFCVDEAIIRRAAPGFKRAVTGQSVA